MHRWPREGTQAFYKMFKHTLIRTVAQFNRYIFIHSHWGCEAGPSLTGPETQLLQDISRPGQNIRALSMDLSNTQTSSVLLRPNIIFLAHTQIGILAHGKEVRTSDCGCRWHLTATRAESRVLGCAEAFTITYGQRKPSFPRQQSGDLSQTKPKTCLR